MVQGLKWIEVQMVQGLNGSKFKWFKVPCSKLKVSLLTTCYSLLPSNKLTLPARKRTHPQQNNAVFET